MNLKDLFQKSQWNAIKQKVDASAPVKKEPRKIFNTPEPEPEPEKVDDRRSDEVVTMFQCSRCERWVNSVTRNYVIRGSDLVPTGEAYCLKCLPHRKMTSLNEIADRRPVVVTPIRVEPRKLIKLT